MRFLIQKLIALTACAGIVWSAFPVKAMSVECQRLHPNGVCQPSCDSKTVEPNLPPCCAKARAAQKSITSRHECKCELRAGLNDLPSLPTFDATNLTDLVVDLPSSVIVLNERFAAEAPVLFAFDGRAPPSISGFPHHLRAPPSTSA